MAGARKVGRYGCVGSIYGIQSFSGYSIFYMGEIVIFLWARKWVCKFTIGNNKHFYRVNVCFIIGEYRHRLYRPPIQLFYS